MAQRSIPIRILLLTLTFLLVCSAWTARSYADANGESSVPVRHLYGTIMAIDAQSLTVQSSGAAQTFPLAQQVNVLLASGDLGTVAQVTAGTQAMVYLRSVNGAPPAVSALAILGTGPSTGETHSGDSTGSGVGTTSGHGNGAVLTGVITAIGNGKLTVQTSEGARTYPLASQVSIRLAGGMRGTLDQVTTDVQATIYLRAGDNGTLLVVGIIIGGNDAASTASPTPGTTAQSTSYGRVTKLTGTITAIGNGSLTIQAELGLVTYSIAPQVTIMRAGGQASTLDQITVGTVVHLYVRSIDGSAPMVVGIIIVQS
jgi:hypothetical protein